MRPHDTWHTWICASAQEKESISPTIMDILSENLINLCTHEYNTMCYIVHTSMMMFDEFKWSDEVMVTILLF